MREFIFCIVSLYWFLSFPAVGAHESDLKNSKILLIRDDENNIWKGSYLGIRDGNVLVKINNAQHVVPHNKINPCFVPSKSTYVLTNQKLYPYYQRVQVKLQCADGQIKVSHRFIDRFSYGKEVEKIGKLEANMRAYRRFSNGSTAEVKIIRLYDNKKARIEYSRWDSNKNYCDIYELSLKAKSPIFKGSRKHQDNTEESSFISLSTFESEKPR